jgi:hypothetical protein
VALWLTPAIAGAQPRSHGFASVGVGATNFSGGADVLIGQGPIGLGGELGVGNLFLASFTASYHPLAARAGTCLDPFATLSLTAVADLSYSATGASAGGGLTCWLRPRVGVRVDAFGFFPARDDITKFSANTTPHYWGVRAGLTFRIR